MAQTLAFEAVLQHGHAALAALSSDGSDTVVPGTTHYIQLVRPDAVITNVLLVVVDARAVKK